MTFKFDLEHIHTTEFGVGLNDKGGGQFALVPVDRTVQAAIREMVYLTQQNLQGSGGNPHHYDPSEKHAQTEYLILKTANPLCRRIADIHKASNFPLDSKAMTERNRIAFYFARLVDREGCHLTALRRAIRFKGALKAKWIQMLDDTLRLTDSNVFQLDSDFDVIVDDEDVHIWRPSAFEFLGGIRDAILEAVPRNVEAIRAEVPFIEFCEIEAYATSHLRAAKLLASVRMHNLNGIKSSTFRHLCDMTNVEILVGNEQIFVDRKNVTGLLEVLDRRRYKIELIPDSPERFSAASRRRVDK